MADETPEVSPTGKPLFVLGPKVGGILAALAALAGSAQMVPGLPPHVYQYAAAFAGLAAALGIMSPGARSVAPAANPAEAVDRLNLK